MPILLNPQQFSMTRYGEFLKHKIKECSIRFPNIPIKVFSYIAPVAKVNLTRNENATTKEPKYIKVEKKKRVRYRRKHKTMSTLKHEQELLSQNSDLELTRENLDLVVTEYKSIIEHIDTTSVISGDIDGDAQIVDMIPQIENVKFSCTSHNEWLMMKLSKEMGFHNITEGEHQHLLVSKVTDTMMEIDERIDYYSKEVERRKAEFEKTILNLDQLEAQSLKNKKEKLKNTKEECELISQRIHESLKLNDLLVDCFKERLDRIDDLLRQTSRIQIQMKMNWDELNVIDKGGYVDKFMEEVKKRRDIERQEDLLRRDKQRRDIMEMIIPGYEQSKLYLSEGTRDFIEDLNEQSDDSWD